MQLRARSPRSRGGLTLVEMLVGLLVLSALAGIALPSMSSSDLPRVDAAAEELASAIRFAREESIRTGAPHGFRVEPSQNRFQVYRADMGTSPPTPIYDVRDPLSKHLYDVVLADRPTIARVAIATPAFTWRGSCVTPQLIHFDATGAAACGDPVTTLLDLAAYKVALGSASRSVELDGFTGRVMIR